MCLIKISQKLIAKEPIFVFKCLDIWDEKYLTSFKHTPVRFNKKGKCVLRSKMTGDDLCITTGIHGYTSFFEALETIKRLNRYHRVDEYLNLIHRRAEVFLAMIPKGTPYYLGVDNDIVCKKMIIFKNNSILNDLNIEFSDRLKV